MVVLEMAGELMLGVMLLAMHIFKYVVWIFAASLIIYMIGCIKRQRTRKKYYGSKYNYYRYYNPKFREGQGRYPYVRMDKAAQKNTKF